jgi:hypothetical protein
MGSRSTSVANGADEEVSAARFFQAALRGFLPRRQSNQVVIEAFEQWLNASCDDRVEPSIAVSDFGRLSVATPNAIGSKPT